MTTEEAIKILDDGNWWDYLDCYIPKETRMELIDALDIADVALRTQQDRDNHEPLTLDELRQMDGEPVRIERLCSNSPENKEWALVFARGCFCRTSTNDIAFFALYGQTWLAYKSKPKEEK